MGRVRAAKNEAFILFATGDEGRREKLAMIFQESRNWQLRYCCKGFLKIAWWALDRNRNGIDRGVETSI
jgi:hypothetical protein